MNYQLRIRLQTTPVQHTRLVELQHLFADACNALAPVVQRTACWNRVALHHLAYKPLRAQFPTLGSQMTCNALYSVSRAARIVYQHPNSPFNQQRLAGRPLPYLRFLPQSPVYFDRHTLSLREGQASMYTLDGRMRFNLPLAADDEQRFRTQRLREIVLMSQNSGYVLSFGFSDPDAPLAAADTLPNADDASVDRPAQGEWPRYLMVSETAGPPLQSGAALALDLP